MRKGRYGPAGVPIAYQAVKPVPGTVTSSRTGIYLERFFMIPRISTRSQRLPCPRSPLGVLLRCPQCARGWYTDEPQTPWCRACGQARLELTVAWDLRTLEPIGTETLEISAEALL